MLVARLYAQLKKLVARDFRTSTVVNLETPVAGMLSQVLIREWYACGSMNNDKQQAWLLLAMANKEKAIDSACSTVGIASLKAKQREAITRFVRGEDVFICLPTGFGKSLCYALLPSRIRLPSRQCRAQYSCVYFFLQCSGSYSTRTLAGLLSSV